MTAVLAVGDRVRFDDAEHQVVALSGSLVRLVATDGTSSVVLVAHLVGSAGFEVLQASVSTESVSELAGRGLEDVAEDVAMRAREWERHVVEVETGLPPGATAATSPRPEYDPQRRGLREREAAKAVELTAAGWPTGERTVQRMRQRYRAGGLRALVDGRLLRPVTPHGRVDDRVVAAVEEALAEQSPRSTGTRDRLRQRVEQILAERHSDEVVSLPSKATFNRLVAALPAGRHAFGAATTRRSAANRPARPFSTTWAARPGQQVQIDTTPLDVLAVFDDGQARRVELTAVVDVATRTICAAILRPAGTKAVDASLLLARMLVPEPMRPGWAETLAMTMSRLPHRQLAEIDARMELAAAKPVVVPETIACDRGKIYLSETFLRSCQTLGISVQPAHPHSPTDKAVVERTFSSINTLFCQYVAGYTGRDVSRRGVAVECEARWSLAQLQDLLDEWIIAGWQQRPHEGLQGPDTARALSPNEMYAVLVSAAGYLPLVLQGEDYIELLPATWRTINDYGIRVDRRTYDAKALNPYRRQHSGINARRGAWEVRYDPYDLSQIWVRNHHDGGWLRAEWTHLPMVSAPFADFTWRHAQQLAPAGADETSTAHVLADLLRRAGEGPGNADDSPSPDPTDRRVTARTQAGAAAHRPRLEPVAPADDDDAEAGDDARCDGEEDGTEDGELAAVIPFGVFDAHAEAQRWP